MDYRPYLDIPAESLASADPGEMNLRLAADIPGSRELDVRAMLHKLYEWTNKVRKYTEKVRPQYLRNPASFDHSPGQFKMMCLLTVLQRDLGVAYQPELVEGLFDARDSRTLFIHGPLTGYGGTCANLPLLFHAICWRLKYPVFVVKTAEHLFLRWDEPGQRFNVETTSRGLVVKTDKQYHHWPKPVLPCFIKSGELLTNLTPNRLLGLTLLQRTHVLRDHLRTDEGLLCTRLAAKYEPFYANEYDFQVKYDRLVTALCRAYRTDFTKLSTLLESRTDWHQMSQRFANDSITPMQYGHRRWAYDHLVRISQLNKQQQERENVRSTSSQELVNV